MACFSFCPVRKIQLMLPLKWLSILSLETHSGLSHVSGLPEFSHDLMWRLPCDFPPADPSWFSLTHVLDSLSPNLFIFLLCLSVTEVSADTCCLPGTFTIWLQSTLPDAIPTPFLVIHSKISTTLLNYKASEYLGTWALLYIFIFAPRLLLSSLSSVPCLGDSSISFIHQTWHQLGETFPEYSRLCSDVSSCYCTLQKLLFLCGCYTALSTAGGSSSRPGTALSNSVGPAILNLWKGLICDAEWMKVSVLFKVIFNTVDVTVISLEVQWLRLHASSAGEMSLIPGQGIKASLVAQMVKNLSAVWETWVQSLGWEDALEKGMATYPSISAWRIPWTEEPGYSPWRGKESDMTEWLSHTHTQGTKILHAAGPKRKISVTLFYKLARWHLRYWSGLEFLSLYWFLTFFFFSFWLCNMTCGILVPQPGIKPRPSARRVQSPN